MQNSQTQSAAALDVMAVSLAALGEFERATATAESAVAAAVSAHDEAATVRIRQHLDSFRARKPIVVR